jgi:hypothetical protein
MNKIKADQERIDKAIEIYADIYNFMIMAIDDELLYNQLSEKMIKGFPFFPKNILEKII